MSLQQFDSSENERAQRMTEEETRAVIRRWQQEQVEQGGLTDKPALPDVAEGLNISLPDAHRLLDEVRAEREAQERLLAQEQIAAEMEQIQLAEEERKLAEVYRQRAELQRQQAEAQRRLSPVGQWPEPPVTPVVPRPDNAESAVWLPSHQEFLIKLEALTQDKTIRVKGYKTKERDTKVVSALLIGVAVIFIICLLVSRL